MRNVLKKGTSGMQYFVHNNNYEDLGVTDEINFVGLESVVTNRKTSQC